MSEKRITQQLLLPDLRYVKSVRTKTSQIIYCKKTSPFEVCPKCASKCSSIYDRVNVKIQDAPIRNKKIILIIRKRRFKCKNCQAIFREPVGGIFKGFKTTKRYRSHIRWAASKFMNLKAVQNHCKCSAWLVYTAYYQQIELELRKIKYPWPKTIGIDEHSFKFSAKTLERDKISKKIKNFITSPTLAKDFICLSHSFST